MTHSAISRCTVFIRSCMQTDVPLDIRIVEGDNVAFFTLSLSLLRIYIYFVLAPTTGALFILSFFLFSSPYPFSHAASWRVCAMICVCVCVAIFSFFFSSFLPSFTLLPKCLTSFSLPFFCCFLLAYDVRSATQGCPAAALESCGGACRRQSPVAPPNVCLANKQIKEKIRK